MIKNKLAMTQRILRLPLKKRWYDMIASGVKKEEYRTIKEYWVTRLKDKSLINPQPFKQFDLIEFKNGYGKNVPTMLFECEGIDIGPAVPEWSDNWKGDVFIIKIGKRIDNN